MTKKEVKPLNFKHPAYILAKRAHAEAEKAWTEASNKLREYPTAGPMGLTPEHIRLSPEFRKHHAAFEAAHTKLRKHNAFLLKHFPKEYRADQIRERDERRKHKQDKANMAGQSNEATMSNMEKALEVYTQCLKATVTKHPEQYGYGVDQVRAIAQKMLQAIVRGTANLNSPSLKATAKQLGIENKLGAWRSFLQEKPTDTPAPDANVSVLPTPKKTQQDISVLVRLLLGTPAGKPVLRSLDQMGKRYILSPQVVVVFNKAIQKKWPEAYVKVVQGGAEVNRPDSLTPPALARALRSIAGKDSAAEVFANTAREQHYRGLHKWVEEYKKCRYYGNVQLAKSLRDKIEAAIKQYKLDAKKVWGKDPDAERSKHA